ncbi:MAG TPA: PrsW family intramembrane metalloprotease, partial [Dongiaceae bacterium]|nr:PrsW family intramembrane metalloprotease [Dongiaceae bacterium]
MDFPFGLSRGPRSDDSANFRTHFLISIIVLIIAALGADLAGRIIGRGPRSALEGARATLDFYALEREYARLVESDVYDLGNHRGLLDAHLSIPKVTHTRHSTTRRDDAPIEARYQRYSESDDPRLRDIGFYGLGYFFARDDLPDRGLEYFDKVVNRSMPYLGNSIGYVLWRDKRDPDRALPYFKQEIANRGNIAGAVSNLSELYWEGHRLQELDALSRDADLGRYVPLPERRYLDLAERRYADYFVTVSRSELSGVTWLSLLSSLAIALMFLAYIYFVDVFEKERVSLLSAIFGMGILSGVLATVLYDLSGAYLGLRESGRAMQDLGFFVLGVGLIEETVKAIPVLIAAFLWKKWNESVDILVFAGASALGFACIENVNYFGRIAIGLIVGRSLTAVVMHLCLTTLAVYGLFRQRYKKDGRGLFWVLGCFGLAVLAHGLYDFFISLPEGMGILSTAILFYLIIVYRNMMQNALGQSEFFTVGASRISLWLY